jgi:hypothetical protein
MFTPPHQINNLTHRDLLLIISIIAATVLSVAILFCGIDFWNILDIDEFYMAINVRDYANSPLGILSFYEGHIFQSIFGESLINLRILTQINVLVSILLAVGFYWHRTRQILTTSLLLITCSLISRICFEMMFDWNTASFPFIVIGAIIMMRYLEDSTKKRAALLGVSIALMSMARMPLVVSLPGAMVFMYMRYGFKTALRDASIMTGTFIITIVCLYFIILGSPSNWIKCWSPQNVITGHTSILLIIKPFKSIPILTMQGLLPLLAIFFAQNIAKLKTRKGVIIAMVVSFIALTIINMTNIKHIMWFMLADRPLMGYFGMAYLFIFVIAFYANRHCNKVQLSIAALLAFTFVAGIGSDIMFNRPIWILTLPMLLVFSKIDDKTVNIWLALTFSVSSIWFAYNFRNYWRNNTVCNNEFENISGLKQTVPHAEWLNTAINDIKVNVADVNDMTVVGQGKYLVNYMLTNGSGYNNNFFHYIDHANIEHVDPRMFEDMAKHNYVLLIVPDWRDLDQYQQTPKAIEDAGFVEIVHKPKYTIYSRKR